MREERREEREREDNCWWIRFVNGKRQNLKTQTLKFEATAMLDHESMCLEFGCAELKIAYFH